MEQLEKIKMEITNEKQNLKKVEENIKQLELKRGEVSEKLSQFNADLTLAETKQKSSVTMYARGEISEDILDSTQDKVSLLSGKRNSFTAVLAVVDADILAAEQKKKEVLDQLKRREEFAWSLIVKNELSKAGVILRRAYAAKHKTGGLYTGSDQNFIKDDVYEATFFGFAKETYNEVAAEKLVKEYFD